MLVRLMLGFILVAFPSVNQPSDAINGSCFHEVTADVFFSLRSGVNVGDGSVFLSGISGFGPCHLK